MRRRTERPTPLLPVTAMKTYAIKSPVETHTKPAHCRDIGCRDYLNGWTIKLLAGSDDDRFFRGACTGRVDGYRRPFTTRRDGPFVTFVFEAGVPCRFIMKHRASLDRPEIYIARGGDWRGSTGLIIKHDRPEHWVEDFAGYMAGVARQVGA